MAEFIDGPKKHDLTKQPKWVRDRIRQLEGNVRWCRGRLAAVEGGVGRIVHGTLPDDKLHLVDDTVEFQLVAPDGHWREDRSIEVNITEAIQQGAGMRDRVKREVVEVRCTMGQLVVEPVTANVIRVYAVPL